VFERAHHQRISAVLRCLDGPRLLKNHCLLGGGTAIVLARDEYREAIHIELCCNSAEVYREIRRAVDAQDPGWLFREPVQMLREPNFHRHGIRLAVLLDGTPVKIEILLENRIPFAACLPEAAIEGVWSLAEEDLVATRLMANTDRYGDDSFMSRDIIDLAMLATDGILSPAGVTKARKVYQNGIDTAFVRAKAMLLESDGRVATCMRELKMKMPPHELARRIERLEFIDALRWWV